MAKVIPGRFTAEIEGPFVVFIIGKHVPATGRRETARRRLGGNNEPAVASPEQHVQVAG